MRVRNKLLYRDSYYKTDANNELEINVAKNRSGSTGKVTVLGGYYVEKSRKILYNY